MTDIPPKPKINTDKTPQELVTDFWERFITKKPGKVTTVFPKSLHGDFRPVEGTRTTIARNAAESYEAAAAECKEKVKQIVRECRRTNEKFADADFDIEADKTLGLRNCLRGLVRGDDESSTESPAVDSSDLQRSLSTLTDSAILGPKNKISVDVKTMQNFVGVGQGWSGEYDCDDDPFGPGSIHRLDWIFENPQFTVDGYSNSDIRQGADGDCWWLAAVATICDRPDLMDKICVARDVECGVYGFVFYRDGEWMSTVVDDNLYLTKEDFDFYYDKYDSTGKRAREYKKQNQTGSDALYFAKCSDPNETWLPLMEKAYAKVHGDYAAISGGWSGEAVEDLTGGVTTTIATNRVLSKNKLWKELVNADGDFVFAASAMGTGFDYTKGGLAVGHAYSILRATEEVDESGNKVRLVLFRNPWGERSLSGIGEWNGPWSDGSKEWTPYWLKKLQHTFGDDGIFWMTFEDMISTYMFLHRTRIFDEKWTVIQRWTTINIPWVTGYLQTKFVVEIKKAGPIVFVLSQLDTRYFVGLEGQYEFSLHFILKDAKEESAEHIVMVRPVHAWEDRSVSAEVSLEPGQYEVIPKIVATRDVERSTVEEVIKKSVEKNPRKLRQVGISYDIAHSKGVPLIEEGAEEAKKGEAAESKEQEKKVSEGDKSVGSQTELKTKDDEKKEPVKEEDPVKVETLEGYKVNKQGKILNEDGEVIGELVEGDGTKCAGQRINGKGEVCDKDGQILGKVKVFTQTVKDASTGTATEPGSSDKTESKDGGKQNSTDEKSPDAKDDKKDDKGDAKNVDEAVGDSKNEKTQTDSDDEDDDDLPAPWNAVCVIGLRVYAQDTEVSIELVKPTNLEKTVAESSSQGVVLAEKA